MLARGQPDPELAGLPPEVLTIEIETAVLLLIVDGTRDVAVVDPERQADRVGIRRTLTAEEH